MCKDLGIEEDCAVANIRLVRIDILSQVHLEPIFLIVEVAAEDEGIRSAPWRGVEGFLELRRSRVPRFIRPSFNLVIAVFEFPEGIGIVAGKRVKTPIWIVGHEGLFICEYYRFVGLIALILDEVVDI